MEEAYKENMVEKMLFFLVIFQVFFIFTDLQI